jgi:hypothetical protein
MLIGQEPTFMDPEYSKPRWLAFRGNVKANPAYDVCRTQQDVAIAGDWKRLIPEALDSHWVAATATTSTRSSTPRGSSASTA